jgi:capsular polysaccharide biosynthesis protein
MPKYYKTTTVIEVKPKPGEGQGFSLGGAGALLGLSGGGGAGSSAEKDASLLTMYRTNDKVLDKISYLAQYYSYENFRYTEMPENNCSISIKDLKIHDYKKYGMEIQIEPSSSNQFKLLIPGIISDMVLGEFAYDTPIHTEFFDLQISHRSQGAFPDKIILNGDKHYIFDKVTSKNFSTNIDKTNPFITVSYLDTLPTRAEAYVQALLDDYIKLSVGFEIEDADITLDTLNKQIAELEQKVNVGAAKMEKFKAEKKILSPQVQAQVLIRGKEKSAEQLIQVNYQLDLLKQLTRFVKTHKNIDAIAPTLTELQDRPTIALITKLQELQLEATSLAQEFKPAYPKLKSIRSQIRSIKSKIRSNLKNLQKTLLARAKSLQKVQKTYAEKLQKAPTAEREMIDLLRDYKFNEKLYAYLLQKRSSAEIKKAEAMSRFRTIEPIYTNPAPAKPKKALIVIVGFITALILSILLAFFREFLRKE